MTSRCEWAQANQLYIPYHDTEWGVPLYDDMKLFEFLVLSSAQAGLSWALVLRRRENYRLAYGNFNPEKIASYDHAKKARLLQDSGIIRNRQKVEASIANARLVLEVQNEHKSFAKYLWRFVEGKPIINHWSEKEEIPVQTQESEAMSKDLKQRGFKFVGPTICYAFMQSVGMVNDHQISCFRHKELRGTESP